MIEFVSYSPSDLARIELQPAQAKWRDMFMAPGYAESLDVKGKAWTGLVDGEPVGSAGFAPQWQGRAIGWAVIGCRAPRAAWPVIVKRIRATIADELREQVEKHGHARVEITVPVGFGAGCRLASLLGFEVEGEERKFGPDGSNHFLYSKVA